MGIGLHIDSKATDSERKVCLSLRDLSNNRKMIFAHESGLLSTSKDNEYYYPERALIMATKDDTVLINRPTDKKYLSYLRSLGLGPQKVVSLNSKNIYEGIENHALNKEVATYSPFISKTIDKTTQEKTATHYIGNPEEITMKYYDKASFKNVCTQLGIETAPGGIFKNSGNLNLDHKNLKALIEKSLSRSEEAIIRHTTGEGGQLIHIANKDNMERVLKEVLKDGGNYVIESKLQVENSPCVIGLIDKDGPTLIAVSSQILQNGTEYAGSIIDYERSVDKKIYDSFIQLGEKMHADGYRGPFGIDFIETTDGKKMPCECNARINGSFYPHELRQNLSRRNIEFNTVYSIVTDDVFYKSFSELLRNKKAQDLIYKGGTKGGIFPFNVGALNEGRAYFIALSNNHDEAKKMTRAFKNILRKI